MDLSRRTRRTLRGAVSFCRTRTCPAPYAWDLCLRGPAKTPHL